MAEEDNQFRAARLEKLAALKRLGVDPYPYSFERTAEAKQLEQRYADLPVRVRRRQAQKNRRSYRWGGLPSL